MIRVDANPNGSIKIEGWEKDDIIIKAKIQSSAMTRKRAEAILSEIEINTED
jgi:hypothetical protein